MGEKIILANGNVNDEIPKAVQKRHGAGVLDGIGRFALDRHYRGAYKGREMKYRMSPAMRNIVIVLGTRIAAGG
jgi:hypothetical protein